MLTSLDHAIVAVRDLASAVAAYGTLLGRRPSWRGAAPGRGTASVRFRLARTDLELITPHGPGGFGELLRARLDAEGEGLLGLAFGTDDAEACAAALRARGLPAAPPVDAFAREDASGHERAWREVLLPAAATRGPLLSAVELRSPAGRVPEAQASVPVRAAIEALDHVVVASRDLDAARTLYGGGLGLRLALDRRFEARRVRILFFRVGGVTVEVGGRLDAPSASGEAPLDRLGGLAWRTPDVDAAQARMAAAGMDVSAVRDGFKPGTRVCTVQAGTCGVPTLLIGPGRGAMDEPQRAVR